MHPGSTARISLIGFLVALLTTSCIFAQSPGTKVDRYISTEMAKFQIPGLAVGVVQGGKVLKLKAYGVSNVELQIPAGKNSVFPLYSATKLFTGVAVMKLVEDGKLSLDTPVTDLLKDLPAGWKAIKIRHLLNFTSGLPKLRDSKRFLELPDDKKKTLSREEAIPFLAEVPLASRPGDKWVYENTGHNILGVIIAKLSGRSFPEFLKQQILDPAGMSQTKFGDSKMVVPGRFATDYIRDNGVLATHTYDFGVDGGNPGSGLNSSMADLVRFFVALEKGRVLKRSSLQQIWTATRLNDGTDIPYGLSWMVEKHNGLLSAGHEGGGAAWLFYYPAKDLAILVLCNLNNSKAEEIQSGVADLYLNSH